MPDHGSGACAVTMFLGTGAYASKTLASVALLRQLRRNGVDAGPFKAVTVLRDRDRAPSSDRRSGLPHHVLAARVPPDPRQCPAVVHQHESWAGELLLLGRPLGRVAVPARDVVDLAALPDAARAEVASAVENAADWMMRQHAHLVVEGAGSPVLLDAEADLANIAVARRLRPRVVLVTEFSGGSGPAALIGTYLCLPPDVRHLVCGFILANTPGSSTVRRAATLVADRCGVPALGTIPANEGLAYEDLYTDPAIDGWATAMEDNVDLDIVLAPGARPDQPRPERAVVPDADAS